MRRAFVAVDATVTVEEDMSSLYQAVAAISSIHSRHCEASILSPLPSLPPRSESGGRDGILQVEEPKIFLIVAALL